MWTGLALISGGDFPGRRKTAMTLARAPPGNRLHSRHGTRVTSETSRLGDTARPVLSCCSPAPTCAIGAKTVAVATGEFCLPDSLSLPKKPSQIFHDFSPPEPASARRHDDGLKIFVRPRWFGLLKFVFLTPLLYIKVRVFGFQIAKSDGIARVSHNNHRAAISPCGSGEPIRGFEAPWLANATPPLFPVTNKAHTVILSGGVVEPPLPAHT